MECAFELRDVNIRVAERTLLADVCFRAPRSGVTVLLGPGGTGKSVLLRALGGVVGDASVRLDGSCRHRGVLVEHGRPTPQVVHMPQAPGGASSIEFLGALREAVAHAIARDADLLVDETVDRLDASARDEAAEILAGVRGRVAAVVVTHDVALARRIGDHVVLLAGGGVVAAGDAPGFFASPPNELAGRFLQQGNCWPAAAPPPLPPHFRFIVPGLLAGMGRPGLVGDVESDLEAIALAGITMLVSLTERPFPAERLRPFGIAPRHFPIADMGVPALGPTMRLCAEVQRSMQRGDAVALHCHAGLGRTGTVLGAQLIWSGSSPADAIATLRATGRAYVQNDAQMRFLDRFAAELV